MSNALDDLREIISDLIQGARRDQSILSRKAGPLQIIETRVTKGQVLRAIRAISEQPDDMGICRFCMGSGENGPDQVCPVCEGNGTDTERGAATLTPTPQDGRSLPDTIMAKTKETPSDARPVTVAEAAKADDRAARIAMHEELCGCMKGPDCPRCEDYMRGFRAALRALLHEGGD